MEKPDPTPKDSSIVIAIAMIVLGLLVFVPSGLCTGLLVVGSIVTSLSEGSSAGWMAASALAIGGPFVVGGGVLIWHGVKELRAYLRS